MTIFGSHRRTLFGSAVLGVAATCAGVELSASAAATSKGTIALMFPNASQPVVVRVLDIAKREAARRGYKFIVSDPGNDLNKQVGVIDTWIQQKINAIESVTPEPQIFEKEAAKARKAGIVWITYAAVLKNEDGYVTWPHYNGGFRVGQELGRWIKANKAKFGGKAQIAILTFEQGQWAHLRRLGMEAALKQTAPGLYQIVSKQDTLTAPGASSIVSTVVQAHPNLNAVLCIIDTPCEGAYTALVHAGHSPTDAKLFVGGMDGTPRAFQLIQQGTFYRASAALKLSTIGKAVIDAPADALETHKTQNALIPYELLTPRTPAKLASYLSDWKKK
jgi:ABC-type sugar transport system substrate-binding protein